MGVKKIIIAWVLFIGVVSTQAAVSYWVGDGGGWGGTADYMDGNSWTTDFANPYGSSPLSTDSNGLVGSWGSPTVWPTISSVIPAANVPSDLGVGWDNPYGELNIVAGGQYNGHVTVGYDGTGTPSQGVLNMTGGTLVATPLTLGVGASVGTVNLSGNSLLHASNASAANGSRVNLADDSIFMINGDWTPYNLVGSIVFATAGGTRIQEVYNSVNDRTEYTVVLGYHTGTIAHWRFEEGTDGVEHAGDQDNFYKDVSGYGNHLSSWWWGARPEATKDCPVSRAVTGVDNSLALAFDWGGDNTTPGVQNDGTDDLGTFSAQTGAKMIEDYQFDDGWTIECSFKIHSTNEWHVLVGKDGKPSGSLAEPPFFFAVQPNGYLEFRALDDANGIRSVLSLADLEIEKWHSAAVTYDNSELKLYLKSEGDAGYALQNTVSFSTGIKIGPVVGTWTVGRGCWNNGPAFWFYGLIDEVRVSDLALAPEKFLNSDEVDEDVDGILDEWELQNFGSTAACVAGEDSDFDGVDNAAEYALGGNPHSDDAAEIAPTSRFVDPDTWEQVYNRRTDGVDGYLNYEVLWKLSMTNDWNLSTKDQWNVSVVPYGPHAERVTINIPVTTYGLSQAFTKIQVTEDWGETLFTQAQNPSPFDGDINAIDDGILSWGAAVGADSYEIYMSTNKALVDTGDTNALVSTQAGLSYNASVATDTYTTYYWKVVPVDSSDPTVGFMPSVTWSFKQTIPSSLGRGHQLVLKRGFLNGTMVFAGEYGFDWAAGGNASNITWSTWNDLNENMVDTHGGRFNWLTGRASPPGINYSRWCENVTDLLNGTGNALLDQWEIFYIGGIENLAMLQATDEQDLSVGSNVTAIKAGFDRWKAAYPNTIVHANIIGTESHFFNGYDNFMRTAKPDMNMVDAYEWNGNGGSLDKHYYALHTMRAKGKIGIGATAYAEPIPNGMWYQCFKQSGHVQTQPEVCLAMYTPLAYGFKALKGWVYSHNELKSGIYADILFTGNNDSAGSKTAYFDVVAKNNEQINFMGDALVRLSNEGVWDVNENGNIPDWASGNVPNITGISASQGAVISYSLPLHEDFDGPNYSNQTYFFLLNGNVPPDSAVTSESLAQTITLTVSGGYTNLESINLTTGLVETIPVSGGGTVAITLDGGRGRLFKFQTGAPFVGFYNGE